MDAFFLFAVYYMATMSSKANSDCDSGLGRRALNAHFDQPRAAMSVSRSTLLEVRRMMPRLGRVLPDRLLAQFHRNRYRQRIRKNGAPFRDGKCLPMDFRVDFMVAGAQKAGTSALMSMLAQHPEVILPIVKEPHFFDNDGFFMDAVPSVEDYHAAFPFEGGEKLYGEGTPKTMFLKRCARRVYDYNPSMKLICILRDPVARAYSAWNMNHVRRMEERGFEELIAEEKDIIARQGLVQSGFNMYLSRGLYSVQIRNLLRVFPEEQLLFLRYDRYREDNLSVFREVCAFLGLDAGAADVATGEVNVYAYSSALDPEVERGLREWFRPDVEDLEALLGWDLRAWKGTD